MYHRERESGASFAAGLLAGAVLGAGIALLLAPKAGTALRGDLASSANSLRDAVTRRYRDVAERAGVEVENLRERAERATEVLEEKAKDLVHAAGEQARATVRRA